MASLWGPNVTVFIICEGMAEEGAVANVAWQQAIGLCSDQPVYLVSDGLSKQREQQMASYGSCLQARILPSPKLLILRRFAHLPGQLIWIFSAIKATVDAIHGQPKTPITVICHSHPMATAVGWYFGPRVKLVMVSHGDIFHRPPGSYDPAITWLYRLTTRKAHRLAAMNVALSPVMAKRIKAHGVASNQIILIPNGIHPSEIGMIHPGLPEVDHWESHPLKLIFIGRLNPVKGVDILLESMSLLRQMKISVSLTIIGIGRPTDHQSIGNFVAKNGLNTSVKTLQSQPRNNLAKYYADCHLVVVPSRDEALPTVVLEAMVCGRPVVGTDVGGIGFLVEDGKTGLVIAPNSPSALANALIHLNHDRKKMAAMAEAALERSQAFTWRANVNKLASTMAHNEALP